jgi:hypothetical protein
MKKPAFIFLSLSISLLGYSQKVYGIVNLTAPFSGISYTNGHNRTEFRPSIAKINGSWGIDLVFKTKKINQKISAEQLPFQKYFKIINKFKLPPNDSLLGFVSASFGTAIDHFIFSYALQKEGKKEKGFLFNSKIRFNYSIGLGVSLNRSKSFYRDVYPNSAGGWASQWTYEAYEAVHHRDGFGVFLKGTGGFDFINKKGKRKLCFNIFYNQGIKEMTHFDIHYQYGYFNDPAKQVDVPKQVLRSRGTSFGFSLGIPVTIIK